MAVESKVYLTLSQSTILSGLVGDRIYPLHRVQSGITPSIVFSHMSGDRVNDLSGYSHLHNPQYQMDIYTTSVDQLRQIGDIVLSVMEASTLFSAIAPTDPFDGYEDDFALYRRTLEFSIWDKD